MAMGQEVLTPVRITISEFLQGSLLRVLHGVEQVCFAAVDRMANCLRVLGSSESTAHSFQDVWLKVCRQSFAGMIKDKLSRTAEELKKEAMTFHVLQHQIAGSKLS